MPLTKFCECKADINNVFNQICTNMEEAIWITMNGGIVYISNAYEEIFGYPYKDLYSNPYNFFNCIYPSDYDAVKSTISNYMENVPGRINIEFRIISADGKVKWVWLKGFSLLDREGNVIGTAGTVIDISAQKITEKKLKNNQYFLKKAQSIAKIGSWQIDFKNRSFSGSDETYNILEISRDESELSLEDIFGFIHKGDIDDVKHNYRHALNKNKIFETQFKLVTRTGKLKYVNVIANVKAYVEGSNQFIVGTLQDITEQKTLELQLINDHNEISKLYELFIKTCSHIELEDMLDITQETIVENLKADATVVCLYDKDNNCLRPRSSHGICAELSDSQNILNISNAIASETYLRKKPLVVFTDDYPNPTIRELLKEENLKMVGSYPIISSDRSMGAIVLLSKENNNFFEYKAMFIEAICSQLGILIQNALLFEQLKNELLERRRAEKESELFFNTGINLMSIKDERGYFKRINPEWSKVLGWTKEELMSKPSVEFVHPDDRKATLGIHKNLELGKCYTSFINRYLCKDGSYRLLEWNAIMLKDESCIIGAANDITEKRELELRNLELEKNIQLEAIKNEFFSNISHEFRTPLNIILSTLELMKMVITKSPELEYTKSAKIKKYNKLISQNTYRLLRLINNLIDITKIDTGYLELNIQNCNFVSLVEEIVLSVAQYVESKGINLTFDTDIEEKYIACDMDKIERIILNLLSNAIKFTGEGGNISVNLHGDDENVVVRVKDSGTGIAEENLKKIFERFKQVDKSLSRRCEGSGIGLALVKSLIEMHGGDIDVKSKLGEGSEFIITIPVKIADSDCAEEEESNNVMETRIHRIKVEFSDIYGLG